MLPFGGGGGGGGAGVGGGRTISFCSSVRRDPLDTPRGGLLVSEV